MASLGLFVAASIPLILAPGPSVAYILAMTLRSGRSTGLASTFGIEAGYLVHVAGTVLGLSALIAASAEAFTVVKIAGAAYLFWLAWRSWRSRTPGTLGALTATAAPARGLRSAFLRAVPIGILNPKTAIFYLAFLPQFADPAVGPVWLQLIVFGLLFIALATVFDSMWAIFGGALTGLFPRLRLMVVERFSAGVLAALAVFSLTARRAPA
ncbi:LysE family translocator [Lysobacter korlensis]|uniref:LysE family translocator n=1 Tax=Lysobacter korlensis TaxID=553636 RepID=A0ABV6RMR1_9GAMM